MGWREYVCLGDALIRPLYQSLASQSAEYNTLPLRQADKSTKLRPDHIKYSQPVKIVALIRQ
jgi:hypothetical protein